MLHGGGRGKRICLLRRWKHQIRWITPRMSNCNDLAPTQAASGSGAGLLFYARIAVIGEYDAVDEENPGQILFQS